VRNCTYKRSQENVQLMVPGPWTLICVRSCICGRETYTSSGRLFLLQEGRGWFVTGGSVNSWYFQRNKSPSLHNGQLGNPALDLFCFGINSLWPFPSILVIMLKTTLLPSSHSWAVNLFFWFFVILLLLLTVVGFELSALHLLGRAFFTLEPHPSPFFVLGYFSDGILCFLSRAGLGPPSSWSLPPE
jgi:hypothetical protein